MRDEVVTKTMKKISILLLAFVCTIAGTLAQNASTFTYPKRAFGFEVFGGYSTAQQSNYMSPYNDGRNLGVRGLYEYNASEGLGLITGLGIDYRKLYEGFFEDTEHTMVGIQIPLLAQLHMGKDFGLEVGTDINYLLVNDRQQQVNEPVAKKVDVIGFGGLRLRLYEGLSFGLGVRFGLSPFYSEMQYSSRAREVNSTFRAAVISIRYLFY